MKRIIKVTVTYDLDDPQLRNTPITSKDIAEKITRKEMEDVFGWDEGYQGVAVEVLDIS